MAKPIWDNPINKHVDWGGDASTENKPVSGRRVQEFVKNTLDSKAGYVYYNGPAKKYQMFSDLENCQLYLSDPVTYASFLIAQFDAPAPYTISTNVVAGSPITKAILAGTQNVSLAFTFAILDSTNSEVFDSVLVTYTFKRSGAGTEQTTTKVFSSGETASLLIDNYIETPGSYEISILIEGRSTGASKTIIYNWDVVQLNLTTTFDFARSILPSTSSIQVPFTLEGLGQKIVEFYIDGVKYYREDIVEDATMSKIFYIDNTYSSGKHNLQIRAYVKIDNVNFYSNTLYREFVISGASGKYTMLSLDYAPGSLIAADLSNLVVNAEQYVTKVIDWGYFASDGLDATVSWRVDGETISSREVSNIRAEVDTAPAPISFVPTVTGTHTLEAVVYSGNEIIILATYNMNVVANTTGIREATDALQLKLSALGRSNTEPTNERNVWSYGNITTTFSNVQWTDLSGWKDDALVLSNGATASVGYQPFAGQTVVNGVTFEIEFETFNVEDTSAVVAQVWDGSKGVQITANEAKLVSNGGTTILTKFIDGERIKLAFIVNRNSGTRDLRIAYIQNNGISERAVQYPISDSYTHSSYINLGDVNGNAGIKIYSIRAYSRALTTDEELNNYMIDSGATGVKVQANDIYIPGTSTVSLEKMQGILPVLTFTGPMHLLFESSSKETQIHCDISFVNPDDPTRNFTIEGGRVKLQGTSSLGYPRKNFKIYMKKDECITRDVNGNIITDWQMKAGAVPCHTFTLKADFSDSSCTHNATIARMYGDIEPDVVVAGSKVLRTPPQLVAENQYPAVVGHAFPYQLRTTPDSFPMVCFYREDYGQDWIFMGQYNFLNDKGNEFLYGFRSIYAGDDPWDKTKTKLWDNVNTHCFEVLNNTDTYGFLEWHDSSRFFEADPETGHSLWEKCFESRYPEPEGTESKAEMDALAQSLQTFHAWVCSCYQVDQGGAGSQAKFDAEYEAHIDKYFMASYYSYLMRFGAVDQVNKNMMLTTYDGVHWFSIRYDNDTINGQRNDTRLIYDYTITRQSIDPETGDYAYAGHSSYLWNALEGCSSFMTAVTEVDSALYTAGLNYANTLEYFDVTQSDRWCERIYNDNGRYKYIEPLLSDNKDYTQAFQGKRQSHRHWWLRNRFDLFDARFLTGEYTDKAIRVTVPGAAQGTSFTVKPGKPNYFGWGFAKTPQDTGVWLDPGSDVPAEQSATFSLPRQAAVGDPVYIYAASSLGELDMHNFCPNFSNAIDVSGCYDETLGTRLKKLVLGDSAHPNNASLTFAGFNNLSRLEYLDIRGFASTTSFPLTGMSSLKNFYAAGSGLTSFTCPNGLNFENLELPQSVMSIIMDQCSWDTLTFTPSDSLKYVDFSRMKGAEVQAFIAAWVSAIETAGESHYADKTLNLSVPKSTPWSIPDVEGGLRGVEWLLKLAKFGTYNITGKFILGSVNSSDVAALTAAFGDTIWNAASPLVIDAESGFILGADINDALAGQTVQFVGISFPVTEGAAPKRFSIQGVSPSLDASGNTVYIHKNVRLYGDTGLMTTVENAELDNTFVVVGYNPTTGANAQLSYTVHRRTYPATATITGPAIIENIGTYQFGLSFSNPDNYTGTLSSTAWSIQTTAGYAQITAQTNTSCTITVSNAGSGYVSLAIAATSIWAGGSTNVASFSSIIHTPTEVANAFSNQALCAQMYNQGVAASAVSLMDIECYNATGGTHVSIHDNNLVTLNGNEGMYPWYRYFVNSSYLDLQGSSNLTGIVDMSDMTNYRFVNLQGCSAIGGAKLGVNVISAQMGPSSVLHIPNGCVLELAGLSFAATALKDVEFDNCFTEWGSYGDLFHWFFGAIVNVQYPYLVDALVFDATDETHPITVYLENNGGNTPNCEYSLNGNDWYTMPTTAGTAITAKDASNKAIPLYLRGTNNTWSTSDSAYSRFVVSGGQFAVSGDITHLLNGAGPGTGGVLILPDYCFYKFFKDCSLLYGSLALAATFVGDYTYASFYENTNVSFAGDLPATTIGEHAYDSMYKGCMSLVSFPIISAEAITPYCFSHMFDGCTSLTNPTYSLPWTTVSMGCYQYMFNGCTGLTISTALPATTLANSCYESMYKGCIHLSSPAVMSATSFANSCCKSMYEGCTVISTAVDISAVTVLAQYCCQAMYKGCTNLTNPRTLPATVLAVGCYANMFEGCTSQQFTTSPSLPALVLPTDAYKEMFKGCTYLNSVTAGFRNWSSATSNWLLNVATNGNYSGSYITTEPAVGDRGPSTVPVNWTTSEMKPLYAGLNIVSKISYSVNITLPGGVDLEYSFDGGDNWISTGGSSRTITFPGKSVLSLRGDNPNGFSDSTHTRIISLPDTTYYSPGFSLSGNIMSLISKNSFQSLTVIPNDYCFCSLFRGGYSYGGWLYDISDLELPTTLTAHCYQQMFAYQHIGSLPSGFLNASTVPDYAYDNMFYQNRYLSNVDANCINASTVGNYGMHSMFYYCSSIHVAPNLPATTLGNNAYETMFYACGGLTSAPATLPATTVGSRCYSSMFNSCTGLRNAPTILATELPEYACASMFYGCQGLTSISGMTVTVSGVKSLDSMYAYCYGLGDLSGVIFNITIGASASGCFTSMFAQCYYLTKAPAINLTSGSVACTNLYLSMFSGCRELVDISNIHITSYAVSSCQYMFSGCTGLTAIPTGLFAPGTLYNSTFSGTFSSCKSLVDISNLTFQGFTINDSSASNYVFSSTFSYCSGLTTIPEDLFTGLVLPATSYVFQGTFNNCTGLTSIPVGFFHGIAFRGSEECINMFTGCTGLTTIPSGLFDIDAIPEGASTNSLFKGTFINCTGITSIADDAIVMKDRSYGMYYNTFAGCTGLTDISNIVFSSTVNSDCYRGMFFGCSNITAVPVLPATTMSSYCYYEMFKNCTSLASVPVNMLPANKLSSFCYAYMFEGCTALVTPPTLITVGVDTGETFTSGYSAFFYMFKNCTTMTSAPAFSDAGTVSNSSSQMCQGMFYGCSSLVHAYDDAFLNIDDIETSCPSSIFSAMFYGCSSLETCSYLAQMLTSINSNGEYCMNGMFYGCTNLTTFPTSLYLDSSSTLKGGWASMFMGCTKMTEPPTFPSVIYLYNGTYCAFGHMFEGCTSLTKIPDLSGVNFEYGNTYPYSTFMYMFKDCVSLTSLIDRTDPENPIVLFNPDWWKTTLLRNNSQTCYGMFSGCTALTEIWDTKIDFEATVVYSGCYREMFQGCSSLELTEINLSNITSAGNYSFDSMFDGCSSLNCTVTLPVIATVSECQFRWMFKNCTSLATLPSIDNVTMVGKESFNGMFTGCSSLTAIPANYFSHITSITGTGAFWGMFSNCTGIVTVADVPQRVYNTSCLGMFMGCTGLETVSATFPNLIAQSCYSSMFNGCTSLTSCSALTSTQTATSCYDSMFSGCTSLVNAPIISATSESSKCFENMFNGCSSLLWIEIHVTSPSQSNHTDWVKGVPSSTSGLFRCPTGYTISRGNSGIPMRWEIENI